MGFRILLAVMILVSSTAQASIWVKLDATKGEFVDREGTCEEGGSDAHRKMILSTFVEDVAIILDAKKNTLSMVRKGGVYVAHESYVRSGKIYDSPRIEVAFGWPAFGFWRYAPFTLLVRINKDLKVEVVYSMVKNGHKCFDKWSGQARVFKND